MHILLEDSEHCRKFDCVMEVSAESQSGMLWFCYSFWRLILLLLLIWGFFKSKHKIHMIFFNGVTLLTCD